MVDVPEEFKNVPLDEWAVGCLVVMSLICGNLGTDRAWSDAQVNEAFSKLASTAPLEIQLAGFEALTELVAKRS